MRKSIAVLLIAPSAVFALASGRLKATVIPPSGLAPGSQYQLIFVTADTRDASSSDIADYNAFVAAEAALNPALPNGVIWHVVASTNTVDARDNAPSPIGIPIYNTRGIEVATAAGTLYGGFLVNPIRDDQFGQSVDSNFRQVRTASTSLGTLQPSPTGGLGTDFPSDGFNDLANSGWAYANFAQFKTLQQSFYALSTPITLPAPEPSTFVLLGSAFLAIGGHRCLRRRQAALQNAAGAARKG
jgi:hypothetical protein